MGILSDADINDADIAIQKWLESANFKPFNKNRIRFQFLDGFEQGYKQVKGRKRPPSEITDKAYYQLYMSYLKDGLIIRYDKKGRQLKNPIEQSYWFGYALGFLISVLNFWSLDVLSKSSGFYALFFEYSLPDKGPFYKMAIEKLKLWNKKIKSFSQKGKLTHEQKEEYLHFMEEAQVSHLVPILEFDSY